MPTISPGSLLLILVIVLVIFGTKRLRSLGSDLGGAVKGFRSAMNEAEKDESEQIEDASDDASFDSTPAQESKNRKDA
ncbi:MAG: twin-arginine translocase TatA/TatE family subunit [Gammaproteobacteria bacterium]|nr:twin-arginine translocase TatA/TatE family subunit [Gammaproteobacteria bacterium]